MDKLELLISKINLYSNKKLIFDFPASILSFSLKATSAYKPTESRDEFFLIFNTQFYICFFTFY